MQCGEAHHWPTNHLYLLPPCAHSMKKLDFKSKKEKTGALTLINLSLSMKQCSLKLLTYRFSNWLWQLSYLDLTTSFIFCSRSILLLRSLSSSCRSESTLVSSRSFLSSSSGRQRHTCKWSASRHLGEKRRGNTLGACFSGYYWASDRFSFVIFGFMWQNCKKK